VRCPALSTVARNVKKPPKVVVSISCPCVLS
jgi:hypothetical protein